ncbi:AhpC/TSA family protein [Micromonospora sp. Llam0]|uniref:redoxin domain-containing protein n=1 Tax=Micromonospora sp. Llam0 TaxID=2485143 RepID=UPI000F49A942|nr:redoxin domain-containing protein [Micromonospora sp. Llam0]ROO50986.1 AhpC/TSA family protein [Micromonospora sp. Llam0]
MDRPASTTGSRPTATPGSAYRFDRFTTALLIDDMFFRADAPGAGNRVPEFDLPTLDGGRFRSADLGPLPVLMVFGSRTCPVTESAGPILRALHAEFAGQVRFVLVNTREAHPGEVFTQPRTTPEKWAHAQELRTHHGFTFEVAVDDIDGDLHRAMTPKPNSAYLLSPTGVIVYRAHWANDGRGLRSALTRASAGQPPVRDASRAMVRPLLRAVGHLPGVVAFAGRGVERDVWRAAAPLAVLGRLSRLFRRLPADRRGPAAAGLLLIIVAVVGGLLLR